MFSLLRFLMDFLLEKWYSVSKMYACTVLFHSSFQLILRLFEEYLSLSVINMDEESLRVLELVAPYSALSAVSLPGIPMRKESVWG